MTSGYWPRRDHDLGTEPGSKYLGKRDWGWFANYAGSTASPSDTEAATLPWAAHPVQATDGNDRTLGIPERGISMWPKYTKPQSNDNELTLEFDQPPPGVGAQEIHRERVTSIIRELTTTIPPRPGPPDISPQHLADLLDRLAPLVFGRSAGQQNAEINSLARQNGIPVGVLTSLTRQTANLIARSTQQPPPRRPGDPGLNRLLDADLTLATQLLFARATLATARAYSDPDLPRLWILANALHHAIPAAIFTTQPAISHGPAARIIPAHDDLVQWPGIRNAIDHLHTTAEAATQGRLWIHGLDTAAPTIDRLLAVGILHLTHPRIAYELLRSGNANLRVSQLQQIADGLPTARLETFTDEALKAVCQRNNWLLGTADERTQRELVERHIDTVLTDDVRARLAEGDTTTLTQALTRLSPTDPDLDQATWSRHPPQLETQQRHQLLNDTSSHAIHRFAGLEIHPHPSKSAAFTGRFPERLSERGLKTTPEALLIDPALRPPSAGITVDPSQLDIPGL